MISGSRRCSSSLALGMKFQNCFDAVGDKERDKVQSGRAQS